MALKNKDGTPYKLNGPNPIMKNQNLWPSDYIIHNEIGIVESFADTRVKIEPELIKENEFIQALDIAKKEIPVKSTPSQVEPKVEKKSLPNNIEKTFTHCLPLKEIIYKKDELYGEEYKKNVYSSPITFESVILDEQDLCLKFWTNSFSDLKEGSIVYFKTGTKRWWKITSIEQKKSGAIYMSVPSQDQPSFD